MVPAPQPASRQQGQKTALVAEQLAAATHALDAASTEIMVPGPTSWKEDGNAPRNKLQPLSLPLQALSSTAPKEEARPLAKRNQLGFPGPASLASAASAVWSGSARRVRIYGCLPRTWVWRAAEGALCNPLRLPTLPRLPVPRKLLGWQRRGWIPPTPCWVLPAGKRNCPQEAHQEEGDVGRKGCAPHIDTCGCFEHPSKACPGHQNAAGPSPT